LKYRLSKIFLILFKALLVLIIFCTLVILVNSALDIYNTFAYDKAIIKDSPYGYTPLLRDPNNFMSSQGRMLSGEFVYVEDWLSAYHNHVAFAKVKSKLKEGYINKDLLVETHLNIKPMISVIVLLLMLIYSLKRFFHWLSPEFN
jgi:hypothetical protein